jgi:Na+-driven multidrug efflux pump
LKQFLSELKSFPKKCDWVLLLLCLVTSGFGLICLASATSADKFGGNLRYMLVQSAGIVLGLIMFACSGAIPMLYNVDPSVRSLAKMMLMIDGLVLPIESMVHIIYFTVRSGGKTLITFLFDSVYMWAIVIPTVLVLSRFTDISIYWLFIAGNLAEVLKCIFGFIFLRKINWARRLVSDEGLKR